MAKTAAKKPAPPKRRVIDSKQKARSADWEAIERDYRATNWTLQELADRYGVTRQAVHATAKKKGWQRDLTDAVRRATKAKVIEAEVRRRVDPQVDGAIDAEVDKRLTSAAERVVAEAEIGAEVVMRHRDDARKARGVAMSLLAELETATMGGEALRNLLEVCTAGQDADPDALADARAAFDKLLGLNSRVGAAQKLADAMTKLQMLERKAFDLDADGDKGKPQGATAKYHIDDDELAAIASGSSR